ncbi:putative Mitogen-activated protein kinase kinase kinase 5 [Blattamonas nauphoetae]|uniref:non-specific serine/threonine protein kinase n=1 Tax=Blattamonas nauphoetae TaxID=2049346 RepID=A0ABQ9Y0Y2_9EUKA|nr:putative Mitogen-activated protein kinase kinase kinase 5 [Blattamonas nauphoetae]
MTSKVDDITPPGYKNPKRISEGAFGQVLKVLHERSGVEYAMKVLPMLKEGDKERVSREVEMLTRFAHARIVRLHESIDMGAHQAIVMELGNRSLNDLIMECEKRGELIPLPLTVMILVDICEGLLWMHTHSSGSTAHGDLKPENVLLRPNNRAFLCDLGGSAPLSQQTSTIGEMGTFEYNSPERVMDSKGIATPASDVWSLGVLANRMVTGKSLFEGMTLPQLCITLNQFNESKIPTTIPSQIRENVALRATTTVLLEGGLLEGMLGAETALSKMKSIQLATGVNETKESSSDAKVKEKTMELENAKQKLLEETKDLEHQLRTHQMSLQRTRERTVELEKEEELEQRDRLLTTHKSPISFNSKDNVLSTHSRLPAIQSRQAVRQYFSVSSTKITRKYEDDGQSSQTILFEEPISEGVVSVAITVLAIPKAKDSIALAPSKGTLQTMLTSTRLSRNESVISPQMREGDRVVLEVDMDARPRTAVFIINGNVPLTFVSGLPPSIRFGVSMENKGVSVWFDGISRLKRATPLRRVNEIKWNPEELRDSDDISMNGMRSSVLTVQAQMPSLVFTDPSHFKVDDNIISFTDQATIKVNEYRTDHTWSSFFLAEPISEGIVAIAFTLLMQMSKHGETIFGLIDGTSPIPTIGQKLGEVKNSVALSRKGKQHLLVSDGRIKCDLTSDFETSDTFVVTINMDSTPRTAQFFIDGQDTNTVLVDLPESVRVGFSTADFRMRVRFDRITTLNRGSPITDQTNELEWPVANSVKATESDKDGADDEKNKRQFQTMKLPELLFTHKSHFFVRNNVLTRTEKGTDEKGRTRPSTVLVSEPITKGVVSVNFVVLTLAESVGLKGFINFGLLDSSAAVPQLGQVLGKEVTTSVGLSTNGHVHVLHQNHLEESFPFPLTKKARVVMEVNMDSTPRTVQFFVNGKAGKCFVSGIPESVRFGFSADVMGTSVQITSIIHSTQPTPLADQMIEIRWTDSQQALNDRKIKFQKILREAEGSMPGLVSRNPEHFKIEGNVITRTDDDSNGLNSQFSTVMLKGTDSCGIVMVGGLLKTEPLPQYPKGLGFATKDSFALCSLDGLLYHVDYTDQTAKWCHSPLRVGDQVVLVMNFAHNSNTFHRFFVNGKAGQNYISKINNHSMMGVCSLSLDQELRYELMPSQKYQGWSEILGLAPKAKKRFEVKVPEPYKFIKTLGQGRFGSVHEVSKTPSDEHFAMKILPFTSESDFEKNEHEISKLSKNQHRNVVGFVEVIEGDNAHFVVLELCDHSLQDELCENQKLGGKMDVVRVYRVMRDVLDGIAFLHSRGEIYGDLKGSNVLIGKDGIAKLGDFGGVVGTGTIKTSNSAECGTMQFWAPEFFKLAGKTESQIGSFAGDMWAFGQLLLEMLTSRSWIVGGSSVEIEKSVLGFDIDEICSTEGIVGEVQILLSLLLSKNPSQRISSAELVRTNRLQSVLGPETPLSRFLSQELDETRTQLLTRENELSAAHEEIRRLKDATDTQRDVPRSPHPTTPAISSFVFTDPSHFRVNHNEITRTDVGEDEHGDATWSSVFLADVFTNGVMSVEFTLLSLNDIDGDLRFGLMDSNNPIPAVGEALGFNVQNSVSFDNIGCLTFNTPSSNSYEDCQSFLVEGDCVRMEVDLDSTPRTVQFFVNGEAGERYMSGIPSSVRIGFSVAGTRASFRLDNFSRLSQPTPLSEEMEEIEW